jgi:hypothetical protein
MYEKGEHPDDDDDSDTSPRGRWSRNWSHHEMQRLTSNRWLLIFLELVIYESKNKTRFSNGSLT